MDNILTQKKLFARLQKISNQQIKFLLRRQRLKFNRQELSFYVYMIFRHQLEMQAFKRLYRKHRLDISYQAFQKNINTVAPLVKFLFYKENKRRLIKPSNLCNIVDTTLLPSKLPESIRQQDYDNKKVTIRSKNNMNVHICGYKALVFINRHGLIYHARLMNINYSDQNILKDTADYLPQLRGVLLADRGFSNKAVRKRIHELTSCKLISPPHHKSKDELKPKEKKLYKRRWRIETVFQKMKNEFGSAKLNIKGARAHNIVEAKLFATFTTHNFGLTV